MTAPSVSFEFFPPKSDEMVEKLWQSVQLLAPLAPAFVSVTYGAGGGTRARTHATVRRIQTETRLQAAAHLTCVGATREEVDEVARSYWASGIRHVVALRGDPPEGQTEYVPTPGGYRFAADLVAGLKRVADFEISVAAYPEVHPEADSAEADLDNLKRKLDAGATRAITQFFFDNAAYARFLDRAAAAGIAAPIVPGVMPVGNFARITQFAAACGTTVPKWLVDAFAGLDDDPDARREAALDVAAAQCQGLLAGGANQLHFYTLNRADLTTDICGRIGLVPAPASENPQ